MIDTVLYRARLFRIYLFIVYAGEDTAWRGATGPTDRRSRFIILLSALGSYAYDESVDVRWSYTTLVRWISEADDHRREIVLAGRQPVCRCILYLFSYFHYLMDVILILIIL